MATVGKRLPERPGVSVLCQRFIMQTGKLCVSFPFKNACKSQTHGGLVATNLFNKEHKATSDEYRKGYDRIKWDSRPVDRDKSKDKQSDEE
jgi:hypothetical protein